MLTLLFFILNVNLWVLVIGYFVLRYLIVMVVPKLITDADKLCCKIDKRCKPTVENVEEFYEKWKKEKER